MVIQKIVQEIIRHGPRVSRFISQGRKYEDKVWRGLYPHKSSRWVVRGSLVTGEIAGSIYRSGEPPEVYGPNVQYPSGKQDQARHRQFRNSNRYSIRNKSCRCRRQSRSRKSYSSSNRFRRKRYISTRRSNSYR